MKMDKTAFSMGKTGEDDTDRHDYKNMTIVQRLEIANYLISVSYGFVNKKPPLMDKTKFEILKRNTH